MRMSRNRPASTGCIIAGPASRQQVSVALPAEPRGFCDKVRAMKTWHWVIVAAMLTAVWLGFMIYMSIESYQDKDPKRIADPAFQQPVKNK